jgi:hypothetical protein
VSDAEERRIGRWPLRLALTLLLALEIFFVVMLTAEGDVGNVPMVLNSVGLLVFCVLTWLGVPWSRWLLVGFLLWRVVRIGIDMSLHFAPGDHRLAGSLMLLLFYVITAAGLVSPLGRSRVRAAA